MAVCELWDVRGRLDHPTDYAKNPEKTANLQRSRLAGDGGCHGIRHQ